MTYPVTSFDLIMQDLQHFHVFTENFLEYLEDDENACDKILKRSSKAIDFLSHKECFGSLGKIICSETILEALNFIDVEDDCDSMKIMKKYLILRNGLEWHLNTPIKGLLYNGPSNNENESMGCYDSFDYLEIHICAEYELNIMKNANQTYAKQRFKDLEECERNFKANVGPSRLFLIKVNFYLKNILKEIGII